MNSREGLGTAVAFVTLDAHGTTQHLRHAPPNDVVPTADSARPWYEALTRVSQISELLPIAGLDYVGPLPPELHRR